jgi:hypothetical protein
MRRFLATTLLALVAAVPFAVQAAPLPAAAVVAVEPTRVADLVLLDRGFNAGLRQGMVCRVTRGTTEIAEVILVELRPTCSAALILSVAATQSIRTGDTAAIKILKS